MKLGKRSAKIVLAVLAGVLAVELLALAAVPNFGPMLVSKLFVTDSNFFMQTTGTTPTITVNGVGSALSYYRAFDRWGIGVNGSDYFQVDTTKSQAIVMNALTGFRQNGDEANAGHVLRANGSNFVGAQLHFYDMPITDVGFANDRSTIANGACTQFSSGPVFALGGGAVIPVTEIADWGCSGCLYGGGQRPNGMLAEPDSGACASPSGFACSWLTVCNFTGASRDGGDWTVHLLR